MYLYIHYTYAPVSIYIVYCIYTDNGTTETRKFVFLDHQTINGNRRLLLQRTCSSMTITTLFFSSYLQYQFSSACKVFILLSLFDLSNQPHPQLCAFQKRRSLFTVHPKPLSLY